MKEYKGHSNNEYLIDLVLSTNSKGDLNGFFTGSENGHLHRFNLLQETPIDTLAISPDGQTLDLLLMMGGNLIVSGRAWQSVVKVEYSNSE